MWVSHAMQSAKRLASAGAMLGTIFIIRQGVDAWFPLNTPSPYQARGAFTTVIQPPTRNAVFLSKDSRKPFETKLKAAKADAIPDLIRAYSSLMKSLFPELTSCRLYIPEPNHSISSPGFEVLINEVEFGALLSRGRCREDFNVTITESCERARTMDPIPSTLLLPLQEEEQLEAEGGVWLVLAFMPESKQPPAQYRLLDACIKCLIASLKLGSRPDPDKDPGNASLDWLLRAVRTPLGALRTFSKLLMRRLERDPEGLSLELAKNVLIQSDRLVDILMAYPEGHETSEAVMCRHKEGLPPLMAEEGAEKGEEEGEEVNGGEGRGGGLVKRDGRMVEPEPRHFELREIFAPIVSAAQLVSSRDGINFGFLMEETLPVRVPVVDMARLQEAVGGLVESAMAHALENEKPTVTLEVRFLEANPRSVSSVVFIVQDNGPRAPGAARPSAYGEIRKEVERIGARLEIRGSSDLGGCQACLYIDCKSDKA